MRLNEILNEDADNGCDEETYLANIKDGGSFNVKACSMAEAREKAKEKLQPGQRLDKVVKDYQGPRDLESKKEKLKTYVNNNRLFKREPSKQKTFLRQIDRATTQSKLQTVSDEISAFGQEDSSNDKTE